MQRFCHLAGVNYGKTFMQDLRVLNMIHELTHAVYRRLAL